MITDPGKQFTARSFRRWLTPSTWRAVGKELALFADGKDPERPHAAFEGGSPDAIYFGRASANRRPRVEPRPRWPPDAGCAGPQARVRARPGARLALELRFRAGRAHLPVVTLTCAA